MPALKRKRFTQCDEEASEESFDFNAEEDDMDITNALLGKAPSSSQDPQEDDEELAEVIRQSVAKRDKRDGTKLIKATKGKAKVQKGEVGGGSFQNMGLHPALLRSLTLRGFKTPTPIQRTAIPTLLASPPRDLVGMARTGSGKTLAYMIPLIQRLGGRHATTFGARALILVPARELALQVLKVGKDLLRGWSSDSGEHAGDNEDGTESSSSKKLSLRWCLVVGGEGLDEQFEMMTNNPDVIIATPGRLLHLIVEMSLDLRSVQYVVFDEADRLFELGFETALNEILSRLPSSRQTLLFSATLPKTLVEFAKAGLQDPKLVRLDAESKISSDLRMAFFSVKQAEKDSCLLVLLRDLIRVPLGELQVEDDENDENPKKSKGKGKRKEGRHVAAPHQTMIFAATKHHVEYLSSLLRAAGYSVAHIYGQLDQAARTQQLERFLRGSCSILVVTDVAARGIDVPILAHVVNYDFPGPGARLFVHRVGRTARAGAKGWAWSFVNGREAPFLLDLQLFLGKPLKIPGAGAKIRPEAGEQPYVSSLVFGTFPRTRVDEEAEYARALDDVDSGIVAARTVMHRAQGMYERSQGHASQASYRRAKEMMKSGNLTGESSIHPVFKYFLFTSDNGEVGHGALREAHEASKDRPMTAEMEDARDALLKAVSAFTPSETVFEVGSKSKAGKSTSTIASSALMKDRRKALARARERAIPASIHPDQQEEAETDVDEGDVEMADEDDIEAAFGANTSQSSRKKFRDSEFYMSHYQKDAATDKGYSLRDGASFAEQARGATFELTNDEGAASRQKHFSQNQVKWDKKKKKFIKGDGAGADNMKLVKTESGARLPATYRSGRFEEWKAKTRRSVPRVGEAEIPSSHGGHGRSGNRFKHTKVTESKALDKLSVGYERKVRQLKKKEADNEATSGPSSSKPSSGVKKGGRYGGKPIGRVKSELKSAAQIRKTREAADRRKAKNARPGRKKGRH